MYERKKRSGSLLCYPFETKRLDKWTPPYITQPKLDGDRSRAVRVANIGTPDDWVLFSSTEEVIVSVPHINAMLSNMNIPDNITELDGELYVHGWTWEQINSVVSRTVNIHPEYEKMEFHVFDVVEEITPQARRIALLNTIAFNDLVIRVPHRIAFTLNDVMTNYQEYLDLGYEGIIVRHFEAPYLRRRSIYAMKFKPKKQDWYVITGWKEEVDKFKNPKGRLGAFVCEGNDGTSFDVGSGLNTEQRVEYWGIRDDLIGRIVVVGYQNIITGSNKPRFPIFIEIKEPF